jgi:hypothetical protein
MTKLAICYWGMTRATKAIYKSHINNLYDVLKNNNIEFNIFMHTWETENNINMIWEHPCDIPVDYTEYQLLNPDFYKIEKQSDFLNTINFENFFNQQLYDIYGGDTHHEWRPQLIRNHLCALESQKRAYKMVLDSGNEYDFILYIRPDVVILNNFDVSCLQTNFDIILPNYDHYEGLNDRFAIIPFNVSKFYSTRIDELIEFHKNNGRIVSEKFVKFIVDKYYKKVEFINFDMRIVRPGETCD